MRPPLTLCLAFTVVVTACGLPAAEEEVNAQASSGFALTLSAADAAAVLQLVNYPGTDQARLDGEVGLDRRAAAGIIAHRNGADGLSPSADDHLFASVTELDAVPWVGDAAFTRLAAFASAHPAPAAEYVEGVEFVGWESEAVVWGVNHASEAELDVTVALDTRAAKNLVAARPFKSVQAMGPVSQVGGQALGALRASALRWWGLMHGASTLAGTFDGVAFDGATAPVALEIANQATVQQLTAHHLISTAAAAMVGGRPYATLAAVSAVSGIGTATLQALHDYAASGQWPEGPATCTFALTQRAAANADDLTELLRIATTLDYPNSEALAFQLPSCSRMDDPATRAALLAEFAGGTHVNWGYDPVIAPTATPFATGGSTFVALVDGARQVIDERVHDEMWAPANPAEQALYDRLPVLQSALADGPRANPGAFYESVLTIEASECTQKAAVLVDPVTNRVWVLHRFPGC